MANRDITFDGRRDPKERAVSERGTDGTSHKGARRSSGVMDLEPDDAAGANWFLPALSLELRMFLWIKR
jgi:hypothetical protein